MTIDDKIRNEKLLYGIKDITNPYSYLLKNNNFLIKTTDD